MSPRVWTSDLLGVYGAFIVFSEIHGILVFVSKSCVCQRYAEVHC